MAAPGEIFVAIRVESRQRAAWGILVSFFSELRRRNVFIVGVAYAVVGYGLVGVADMLFPRLLLPDWTVTFVLAVVILGFPMALLLSWAYDLTPQGIRRATPIDESHRPPSPGSALAGIAVLPFRNLMASSPHGYLAEAIPMELQNSLLRVHDLRVVSGLSAAVHGTAKKDLKTLAQALNVDYVICGSIAQGGDKIRIMAELDDATNDTMLWSETYETEVDDLLDVQRKIAESIAGAFGGERLRAEIHRADAASAADLTAWQLVQKARAYLLEYDAVALEEAIASLERAVALDPSYAAAHATLGMVVAERTLNGLSNDPVADRASATVAIERAESLSPQDPVVLRAGGCAFAYCGDYRRSLESLKHAVALAPFDLGAWGYLGWPIVATGNPTDLQELHGILDRLIATAPSHPGQGYWLFHKAVAHSCEQAFTDALEYSERSTRAQPRFAIGWMNHGNILASLGRNEEATAAIASGLKVNPQMTVGFYSDLMEVLSDQDNVIESRRAGLRLLDEAAAT